MALSLSDLLRRILEMNGSDLHNHHKFAAPKSACTDIWCRSTCPS